MLIKKQKITSYIIFFIVVVFAKEFSQKKEKIHPETWPAG